MRIDVEGADRLAATIDAAAAGLERMAATNRQCADVILTAAHPPIRTGKLAASGTASGTDTEAVVTYGVRYAPFVEARRRFLAQALAASEQRIIALHLEHVDECLAGVKGA